MSLHLRNNREIVDNHLIDLITKCIHLQYLEFEGVLSSVAVLKQICDLQCNYQGRGKYTTLYTLSVIIIVIVFHRYRL